MAISTYKTFLMKRKTASGSNVEWEKVIDIKDFPNLGGEPELLDTTTLSDYMETKIPGIQKLENMEFTCNYTLDDYKKIKALAGKEETYAVWLGGTGEGAELKPTGSDGKFKFKGTLSVYKTSGSVNAVQEMKITIAPSSVIELDSE